VFVVMLLAAVTKAVESASRKVRQMSGDDTGSGKSCSGEMSRRHEVEWMLSLQPQRVRPEIQECFRPSHEILDSLHSHSMVYDIGEQMTIPEKILETFPKVNGDVNGERSEAEQETEKIDLRYPGARIM
jgi:hypothetical protein